MGIPVHFKRVRIAYTPYLFTPRPATERITKERYGVALFWPKESPYTQEVLDALEQVTALSWPKYRPTLVSPLMDGDKPNSKGGSSGLEGHYFINAYRQISQRAPMVLGRDAHPINASHPDAPYPGCYVNALVDFYADTTHQKLCIGLTTVQSYGYGTHMGGSDPAATLSQFSAITDEALDEALQGML